MIDLGQVQAPPSKEQILEELRSPLQRAIAEVVDAEVDPERIWTLRKAQQADFNWRGLQWISPNMLDSGISAFSANGSPITGATENEAGYYDYIQNIYRGYGRKFIAVLGQRIPNVTAVPDDPEDDASLELSELANRAATILRGKWDIESRMLELCYHLWNSGTVFVYTPWVTDKYKYGSTKAPTLQSRTVPVGPGKTQCLQCGAEGPEGAQQCPQCSSDMMKPVAADSTDVPEISGQVEYDNGAVEFHLCTITTIGVPYHARSLEDAPWIDYRFMEWKYRLMAIYGDRLKDVPGQDGSSGSSAPASTAQMVLDAQTSPLGVPNQHRENRWDYRRLWMKPENYYALKDKSLRQLMQQQFPEGAKLTIINNYIVDIENERMEDVWAACKPETSEFIWCDSMGQDMLDTQKLRNDTLNIAYQTVEGGLPLYFADPRVLDVEWLNENKTQPNSIIPVIASLGSNLGDSFYATSPSVFSDQMIPWMQGEEATARSIVGTTEAVFGGVVPGGETTAHEAELRKNAAMMQFGTTWVNMRRFFATAYTNGVKLLARYGTGMLRKVQKGEEGYESLVVDLSKLQETGWHFEAEEAFPMTHAEQRAYLLWMLANQQLALSQGFMDARNVRKNHALLGFEGYHVPDMDVYDKGIAIINRLLKSAPIQQPKPDGSVDLVPSIPIDQFDEHGKMAQVAYSWCISKVGRRVQAEQEGQVAGFANVVAWGKAHFVAANPTPPPPPPPPAKLSVSLPLDKVDPQTAQTVLQDFHLVPGSPPPAPATQGSAPAQPGAASQPPTPMPPGVAPGTPPPPNANPNSATPLPRIQ